MLSRPAGTLLGLLACLALAWPLVAGEAPPRSTIVSMAQHFVQQQFMRRGAGHYHIEFDLAYLHPQPDPDFWAVVGGFVSEQATQNSYVVAIRQICDDFKAIDCWRMEKLAINEQIILNLGKPL